LSKKENQWSQLIFYSDLKGILQKKSERSLSEDDGMIAIHGLRQYHLFDIMSENILLEEHKKLCGIPSDPSHYIEYDLIMISGRKVRKLHFSNPKGRYEMCPAIKQWENAGKISDFFEEEWKGF